MGCDIVRYKFWYTHTRVEPRHKHGDAQWNGCDTGVPVGQHVCARRTSAMCNDTCQMTRANGQKGHHLGYCSRCRSMRRKVQGHHQGYRRNPQRGGRPRTNWTSGTTPRTTLKPRTWTHAGRICIVPYQKVQRAQVASATVTSTEVTQ